MRSMGLHYRSLNSTRIFFADNNRYSFTALPRQYHYCDNLKQVFTHQFKCNMRRLLGAKKDTSTTKIKHLFKKKKYLDVFNVEGK